jgi:hypothetical protein
MTTAPLSHAGSPRPQFGTGQGLNTAGRTEGHDRPRGEDSMGRFSRAHFDFSFARPAASSASRKGSQARRLGPLGILHSSSRLAVCNKNASSDPCR